MRVSLDDSDSYDDQETLSETLVAWRKALASAQVENLGKVVIKPISSPQALSGSDTLRLQREQELEKDYEAIRSYQQSQEHEYNEACRRIDAQLSNLRLSRKERMDNIRAEAEKKRSEELEKIAQEEKERKARKEAEIKANEERKAREKAEQDAQLSRRLEAERKEREAVEERERERERVRKLEQEKEKERQEAKQRSEEERAKAELKRENEKQQAQSSATNFAEVDREYSEVMDIIQHIKNDINAPVSANKELKKHCFSIRMKLKPKFGQLTNSKRQLIKIRNEVKELIQASQSDPLVYQWTLNQYAKCVVQQAESEANVKVQAALPLAMLTVLLWTEFPELGRVVIARFVKKCPQLIGYCCSTETDEGRGKMRYRKHDGFWETDEQYGERMAGICSVWAAMTQSKLSGNLKHPYPMSHGWKFLARNLNRPKEQVPNASYCTVAAWWDVSAMRFVQAYGRQGEKLLRAASGAWTENAPFPAAHRLRLLGDEWLRTNILKPSWKPLDP